MCIYIYIDICMYIYIYIHMCVHTCMYMCIYIYIHREREGEGERDVYDAPRSFRAPSRIRTTTQRSSRRRAAQPGRC